MIFTTADKGGINSGGLGAHGEEVALLSAENGADQVDRFFAVAVSLGVATGADLAYGPVEGGFGFLVLFRHLEFHRVGSATKPMTARQIDELFASRTRNSLGLIASPRQDLRFTQLHIYYQGAGLQPGPLFTRNLELEREDCSFNLAAFLLADANSISIRFAKYSGADWVGLIENEEFGNCCLVKAANQLLDRLEVENRTLSRITPRQREDRKNFDPVAIREAVINAIVHNDYSYDGSPKVELFADRLEITSTGGIPPGAF